MISSRACSHERLCDLDPHPWPCQICGQLTCYDCSDAETGLCSDCCGKLIRIVEPKDEHRRLIVKNDNPAPVVLVSGSPIRAVGGSRRKLIELRAKDELYVHEKDLAGITIEIADKTSGRRTKIEFSGKTASKLQVVKFREPKSKRRMMEL